MYGKKQQPSSSSSSSSSSSMFHYRQSNSASITVIHRPPSPNRSVVIPVEPFDENQNVPYFAGDQRVLLSRLVGKKNIGGLTEIGGVEGVAASLKSQVGYGIDGSSLDIDHRKEFFGENTYPAMAPTKRFFHLLFKEFKDLMILILLVCAALLLGFGIKRHGVTEGWYDGTSMFAVIFLAISSSATFNFWQNMKLEKHFEVMNNNRLVVVMRNGRRQEVRASEIVVGEVVYLNIGDQVAADGLFIEGHSLVVDESRMMVESNHVEISRDQNPFLFSGTKIVEGRAIMLVTAVGMNTNLGEMMSMASQDSNKHTPLCEQLHQLTLILRMVGLAVACLVFVVLLVFYFTRMTRDENGNKVFIGSRTHIDDLINSLVDIIATAVVIMLLSIPQGLTLAIRLTHAYSAKSMMADQAIVRNLSACELMAFVTTICTDMRSIIASNQMRVTKFFVGEDSMEGESYTSISAQVLELFFQGIAYPAAYYTFSSVNPIDETIRSWAVRSLNMEVVSNRSLSLLNVKVSYSESWRIGISLRNPVDKTIHLHWKGDADNIFRSCSHYYDSAGNVIALGNTERERLLLIIEHMGSTRLRCIAFAHRKLSEGEYETEAPNQEILDSGLILLGLAGVATTCSPNIRKAIKTCTDAGVQIKLITSENVARARDIALECGLLSSVEAAADAGSVVVAQEFFNSPGEEQRRSVGDVRVMAMSSDDHKLEMVRLLKAEDDFVVAVTGVGTSDAPALKEAHVGLCMGKQATEVAKESSDVVLLDDNFFNVVKGLSWGQCIYNNVQKFIQFQLTVNLAALVINLVSVVSSGEPPLSITQLLWVNLIVNTLGALALATERPTKLASPVNRAHPLVSNGMWRNIVGQALYQIAVVLTLKFEGNSIFSVHKETIDTLIFSTFVLCQVFNQFNARTLEEKNMFEGILKNRLFIGLNVMTVILQVILVEFLNKFADTERLNLKEWAASIGIAALSWPFGWLIKRIPVPQATISSFVFIF